MWNNYTKNNNGNFSIFAAVSLMVLMLGVGAAIDANGMHKQKNWQQDLTDAAALAAVRSGETEQQAMQVIAQNTVDSINDTNINMQVSLIKDTEYVQVTSNANYGTAIMGIFGKSHIPVESLSEVPIGASGGGLVNIALVLDNTESMRGGKLNSLKTHASAMVDTLQANNPDTNIAVIPFNQYVNVGMQRRDEIWMNVPDDSDGEGGGEPYEHCWDFRPRTNPHNCRWVTRTIPTGDGGSRTSRSRSCDYDYGEPIERCTTRYTTGEGGGYWTGCVDSRPGELAGQSGYFDSSGTSGTPYNGVMDTEDGSAFHVMGCGTNEILPMTSSFSAVRSAIADLQVYGDTYIPAGLMWGWNALLSDIPIGVTSNADPERTRALVLMSDGTSTVIPLPGEPAHYATGGPYPTKQDFTEEMCESIKDDGIEIHTIAYRFPPGANNAMNMMRDCASDEDKFYDADSNNELASAFQNIANSFGSGELRLSR